jgi:hypothetical protein
MVIGPWVSLFVAVGSLLFVSCQAPQVAEPAGPPFTEEDKADIVIRYYSDSVNRILKPRQAEGQFLSTFDINATVELAKQQPGRELAVVILIFFNMGDDVKLKWIDLLKGIGYRRVVFLRGAGGMKINGLSVLDDPAPVSLAPKKPAESKP